MRQGESCGTVAEIIGSFNCGNWDYRNANSNPVCVARINILNLYGSLQSCLSEDNLLENGQT